MYRPNEQDNGMSLTRVLIAIGLSIAFFAIYAYFFPQKPHQNTHQAHTAQNTQDTQESIQASTHTEINTQVAPHQNIQDSTQSVQNEISSSAQMPHSLKQTIIARVDSDEFAKVRSAEDEYVCRPMILQYPLFGGIAPPAPGQ